MSTIALFNMTLRAGGWDTDLGLTCDKCDEIVCTAQEGDSLECLVLTAQDHECGTMVTPA